MLPQVILCRCLKISRSMVNVPEPDEPCNQVCGVQAHEDIKRRAVRVCSRSDALIQKINARGDLQGEKCQPQENCSCETHSVFGDEGSAKGMLSSFDEKLARYDQRSAKPKKLGYVEFLPGGVAFNAKRVSEDEADVEGGEGGQSNENAQLLDRGREIPVSQQIAVSHRRSKKAKAEPVLGPASNCKHQPATKRATCGGGQLPRTGSDQLKRASQVPEFE